MARIVTVGHALQSIYLIDRNNFSATEIGGEALFTKLLAGSTLDVEKISYELGGSGINTAIEFARHGHETIFLGNVARDSAGAAIINLFNRENIDASYTNVVSKKTTGTSVILLDPKNAKKVTLKNAGASDNFSELDLSDLELIQPDWLYVSTLNGDMRTLLKLFEKAKSLGAKIMFNPGPKELAETKKLVGLLQDVDILYVNKTEAANIVPGAILSELLAHLQNYVQTVIITDGQMGGIATNHEETYRFGIYEDVPVKDTTGSGDAFGAGFLAHFAAGKSFRTSLVYASANATSNVTKIGTTRGALTGVEPLHPMLIQKL
ncbi:MAG: carbohydrate kinase family protein [Candidatus Saccharibacteria bacterium]|nr:carbohydrate kinase family protein [Candidatus Saccharibacteria bacterium]